jgi:hypothetical protein
MRLKPTQIFPNIHPMEKSEREKIGKILSEFQEKPSAT